MSYNFELSLKADHDLEEIFDYTFNESGADQAVSYVSSFDDIFPSIAKNPEIGRERNEIRRNLRSIAKEKHIIFYKVQKDKIRIIRVLHGSKNLINQFK